MVEDFLGAFVEHTLLMSPPKEGEGGHQILINFADGYMRMYMIFNRSYHFVLFMDLLHNIRRRKKG